MGTLQKNVKGGRDRHMHGGFGSALLERWFGTPYTSTPNPAVGDTSKATSRYLHPTKGYSHRRRQGNKSNNRCK